MSTATTHHRVGTASLCEAMASFGVSPYAAAEKTARLLTAVRDGAHFGVSGLLQQGASAEAAGALPGWCSHAVTPLSIAAACNQHAIATLLMQAGAKVNTQVRA